MKTVTEPPFVIKICGITNEEDARVAVEAGANALGFNFYKKSPRYITVECAREIIDAVPGDYLSVGVYVNPQVEAARAILTRPPDVLQLHGDDPGKFSGMRVWRAISPGDDDSSYPGAEAYLIDTPTRAFGGSGKVFDWTLATRKPYRVLLAGGLDGSNVAEAIATAKPWGVDACSRLELRPGKKDARKIAEFVSAAREAFTYIHQEVTL